MCLSLDRMRSNNQGESRGHKSYLSYFMDALRRLYIEKRKIHCHMYIDDGHIVQSHGNWSAVIL